MFQKKLCDERFDLFLLRPKVLAIGKLGECHSSLGPFETGQHISAFSVVAWAVVGEVPCIAQSFRDHAEDLLWPPLLLPMLSERDLRP
jgi:hypothetical protein